MVKRKTTAQFIQQARKIHGDKYDYSMVEYVNNYSNVKIICPAHGLFEQIPNTHLQGKGCADCGGSKKKTTDRFIEEARKVHGDKYDYSMVEYIRDRTHVKIICPVHGLFDQQAGGHLQGRGCIYCSVTHASEKRTKTTDRFIEEARKVHGDKYDYSMVEYIRGKAHVKIICPAHGLFEQIPTKHLQGSGCTDCAGIRKKTTDRFIEEAQKVHCDKYDYSMVEYINAKVKVKVICPDHGAFEQIPNSHLKGSGCTSCCVSGFNTNKEGILYFLKFEKDFATFWKIGITNRTVEKRFKSDALFVTDRQEWHFDKGLYAYQIEQTILKEFAKFRYEIPLFSLLHKGGDSECFSPSLPHKKVIATVERLIERIKAN
jgi:hypothetical protein